MQNWGKTKVQCLVRNTHSGVYYARAKVNGKLLWKTLETDSLTVAKARLPKVLAEIDAGEWAAVYQSQQCGDLIEFLAFSGCRLGEAEDVRWTVWQ